MKIYNKIEIAWNEATQRYDDVVYEDSYAYEGELMLAHGNSVDMTDPNMSFGVWTAKINIGCDGIWYNETEEANYTETVFYFHHGGSDIDLGGTWQHYGITEELTSEGSGENVPTCEAVVNQDYHPMIVDTPVPPGHYLDTLTIQCGMNFSELLTNENFTYYEDPYSGLTPTDRIWRWMESGTNPDGSTSYDTAMYARCSNGQLVPMATDANADGILIDGFAQVGQEVWYDFWVEGSHFSGDDACASLQGMAPGLPGNWLSTDHADANYPSIMADLVGQHYNTSCPEIDFGDSADYVYQAQYNAYGRLAADGPWSWGVTPDGVRGGQEYNNWWPSLILNYDHPDLPNDLAQRPDTYTWYCKPEDQDEPTNYNDQFFCYIIEHGANTAHNLYGYAKLTRGMTSYGCTDPTAANYDPDATVDDGNCQFGPVIGYIEVPTQLDDTELGVFNMGFSYDPDSEPPGSPEDPNPNAMTWSWSLNGDGELSTTSGDTWDYIASYTFAVLDSDRMPVGTSTQAIITVTATDSQGYSASEDFTITINGTFETEITSVETNDIVFLGYASYSEKIYLHGYFKDVITPDYGKHIDDVDAYEIVGGVDCGTLDGPHSEVRNTCHDIGKLDGICVPTELYELNQEEDPPIFESRCIVSLRVDSMCEGLNNYIMYGSTNQAWDTGNISITEDGYHQWDNTVELEFTIFGLNIDQCTEGTFEPDFMTWNNDGIIQSAYDSTTPMSPIVVYNLQTYCRQFTPPANSIVSQTSDGDYSSILSPKDEFDGAEMCSKGYDLLPDEGDSVPDPDSGPLGYRDSNQWGETLGCPSPIVGNVVVEYVAATSGVSSDEIVACVNGQNGNSCPDGCTLDEDSWDWPCHAFWNGDVFPGLVGSGEIEAECRSYFCHETFHDIYIDWVNDDCEYANFKYTVSDDDLTSESDVDISVFPKVVGDLPETMDSYFPSGSSFYNNRIIQSSNTGNYSLTGDFVIDDNPVIDDNILNEVYATGSDGQLQLPSFNDYFTISPNSIISVAGGWGLNGEVTDGRFYGLVPYRMENIGATLTAGPNQGSYPVVDWKDWYRYGYPEIQQSPLAMNPNPNLPARDPFSFRKAIDLAINLVETDASTSRGWETPHGEMIEDDTLDPPILRGFDRNQSINRSTAAIVTSPMGTMSFPIPIYTDTYSFNLSEFTNEFKHRLYTYSPAANNIILFWNIYDSTGNLVQNGYISVDQSDGAPEYWDDPTGYTIEHTFEENGEYEIRYRLYDYFGKEFHKSTYITVNQMFEVYPSVESPYDNAVYLPYQGMNVSVNDYTTDISTKLNINGEGNSNGYIGCWTDPSNDDKSLIEGLDGDGRLNLGLFYWLEDLANYMGGTDYIPSIVTDDETGEETQITTEEPYNEDQPNWWLVLKEPDSKYVDTIISRDHGIFEEENFYPKQFGEDENGTPRYLYQSKTQMPNNPSQGKFEYFVPDVDVRSKLSFEDATETTLQKYFDKDLQPQSYVLNSAPVNVMFTFYGREGAIDTCLVDRSVLPWDKTDPIKANPDYSGDDSPVQSKLWLMFVEWGDGQTQFYGGEDDYPHKLINGSISHNYQESGIYTIKGMMVYADEEYLDRPNNIKSFKPFELNISINKRIGYENEFEILGGNDYKYIPYDFTTPIVGGISEQSQYYKNLSTFSGFRWPYDTYSDLGIDDVGYKLKTEQALTNINQDLIGDTLLNYYGPFYEGILDDTLDEDGDDTAGTLINNGIQKTFEELGDWPGNIDIGQIRAFNKPLQMYEMLGFEEDVVVMSSDAGNPGHERHWKKIIPKDYDIFCDRSGIECSNGEIVTVDQEDEQVWDDNYYYPVLPKLNKAGMLDETKGLQGFTLDGGAPRVPFGTKETWDAVDIDAPVTQPEITDESLATILDLDMSNISQDALQDLSGNANVGMVLADYGFNRGTTESDSKKLVSKTSQLLKIKRTRKDRAF